MLPWLLLTLAAALLALGLLNVFPAPTWTAWQLGVLAGEYGHWLALMPVALALASWWSTGASRPLAMVTIAISVAAAVMLLKPALQAACMARSLPGQFAARFGPTAISRPAFSWLQLFAGPDEPPVDVETLRVSEELPLDLYRPRGERSRDPVPCVIVVHGGGWDSGDRTQLPQLNHWLACRGYAVAALSYRLAPQFLWPAPRDDVQAAIAYLKAHAAQLGIDATRLVLLGRSAGGQIALTLAYTAGDPALRGAVGLYAPSDLYFGYVHTHEDDMLHSPHLMRQYLGGPPEAARAAYDDASALSHVTPRVPATLLLHGANDTLVWHRHSERLDAALADAGVPRAFVSLPWATHAFDYNLHGPGGQLTCFALEWFLARVTRRP